MSRHWLRQYTTSNTEIYFFKIQPKLIIFQILAKNDDFSNFGKNLWFFKIQQKMMVFRNLVKKDDFFSNLAKNYFFSNFFQKMMIFQIQKKKSQNQFGLIPARLDEKFKIYQIVKSVEIYFELIQLFDVKFPITI